MLPLQTAIFFLLILLTQATSFALKPSPNYITTPSTKERAHDSLNIVTADSVRLTGWLLQPESSNTNAVIIMAGGDAGNMSYNVEVGGYFVDLIGAPVLLFDYRGFGTSTPFTMDTNQLTYREFATDIEGVIAWARQKYPTAKIILFGQSMGASLSMVVASRRKDIAGVIADSPYIAQKSVVDRINARRKAQGDPRVVTYVGGNALDPMANSKTMKSIALLIIHGRDDTAIPPDEVSRFYKKYPAKRKELWLVPGASHHQAMSIDPQKYADKVETFVKGVTRVTRRR